MSPFINIPVIPQDINQWARQAGAAINELAAQNNATIFTWNKGCLTVPTNTTIAGAAEIFFESEFTGNGTLVITVFDAEGGVNVALNGVELGALTGAAGQEVLYEVPVTNLVEGDDPLNVFNIWSTSADTAELRKLEVYRNFTKEQISDSAIWGNITGVGKPSDDAQVNAPSLALKINVNADGSANNGEAALIATDGDGAPDFTSDGFIFWDGAKVIVARVQTAGVSIATSLVGQQGFICFETALDTPFTVESESTDVAFVFKSAEQWQYDNNTSAVDFTPTSTMVALGWLETSTSDLILNAGLFGNPISLEIASFPAASAGQTPSEFNEARTYVKFDGSVNGSRLEVADDDAWDFEASEAGTWEWWAYVDSIGVQQAFLGKNFVGILAGFGAAITAAGDFSVRAANGTTGQNLIHQTPITARLWNHFAFARTAAGVITSYLNGVPSSTTITENATMANSVPLQFGVRDNTTEELTGRMRDIRRWSDVRMATEIRDNIFVDLIGDEAGLIGFWPTREGTRLVAFQKVSGAPASDADFITAGPTWSGAVGEGIATEGADNSNLADDAVSTPKVVDDAITKQSIAENGSAVGPINFSGTPWTDVVSISFTKDETSSGVSITAVVRAFQNSIFGIGRIRVLRDTTDLKQVRLPFLSSDDVQRSLEIVDSPAAGTFTYKVQIIRDSGTGTVNMLAGDGTLKLQEFKK